MGAFRYEALDPLGKTRRGLIEADHPRLARQQLRDQGLTPLHIEAVEREREQRHSGPRRRTRLPGADLALLTRQLATLVGSGLTIEDALAGVSQQAERGRLAALLLAVRARVLEGHPLAVALADFPLAFPEMYRATVAAGEQTGHLALVLERLADYTESRMALRQRVMLALLYPVLLTVMALLVVTGLLAYVVPEVVQVFEGIGQQLPWLTRALIVASDLVRTHGLLALAVLATGALAGRLALQRPGPARAFDHFQLRLPLVGRLVRGLNAARGTRTLGILLDSGVPVLEALRIAAQVVSCLPMRDALQTAAVRVREGSTLHAALRATGMFPPMTVQLIASGEASGRLGPMLERAATHQERETETLIAGLLGIFEPLLILVMGLVVLAIVLAILLPIFDLNRLVA